MHLGIAFHMFSELDRQRDPASGRHSDNVNLWVGQTLLRDGTVTLDMCYEFMRGAWEKLGGAYGFADMFITHRTGRVSPLEEKEAPYVMKANVYTSKVMLPGADLRSRAPDAYWLNFFNASHVQAIGGAEHTRSQLPKAHVGSLAHGGLSIQISPSPIYDSLAEWQADHLALEKVLAPILWR
jgi:hypothetical protein